ncbi:hypothetical protein BDP27DRAFT_1311078 [Rhodocollybia butyracea]|uniref:DUF6699 domain-containing protein n=1 Tax=Rhodocollybia butyracea TaxID=206335 RepID=A0A9P5UEN8_9AGAR|nr:hypothetical protein BDP27DRAFT_1311078 [Rhodocollybia butyracea]
MASLSETRVTFGALPDGPSRRFGPQHRSTMPSRSIMRRPKAYARHSLGHMNSSFTIHPPDPQVSFYDVWRSTSYRPSVIKVRSNSPAPNLQYVKHGHSNVFSYSPLLTPSPRSSSRHKRHSSASSSGGSHRRSHSVSGNHHKWPRPTLSHAFKAILNSGSHTHHSSVSGPHKLGHSKRSSTDKSVGMVTPTHSSFSLSSSRNHNQLGPLASSDSANRGFMAAGSSISPFDLQNLGYALPPPPYASRNPGHMTPSPPHNSFIDFHHCIPSLPGGQPSPSPEVHYPWTQSISFSSPPKPERVHVHTELLSSSGHTLQWNMMLPPKQNAVSGFSDPSSVMYPGDDSASQDFLHAPACPGAAKIIIRPGNNASALGLWMNQWGPLEIYPYSSSAPVFENEISVLEVLQALYSYFQIRLSSQATIEMPVESRQRIAQARAQRVVFEGAGVDNTEWDRPPKRVDVLALWSVFGGLEVCYGQGYGSGYELDEPGWRVVDLELKLRSA